MHYQWSIKIMPYPSMIPNKFQQAGNFWRHQCRYKTVETCNIFFSELSQFQTRACTLQNTTYIPSLHPMSSIIQLQQQKITNQYKANDHLTQST